MMLLIKSLGKAGNNLDGDKMSAERPLAAGEQHMLLEEDYAQTKKRIDRLASEKMSQVKNPICSQKRFTEHWQLFRDARFLAPTFITQCKTAKPA